MAHPVDQRQAVRVAQNFVAQRVKAIDTSAASVVYTHVSPKSGEAAIYAVNVGGAFVLVSADDVAHPVLGYSFSRPWPAAPKRAGSYLPSQVSGYLDDLANQIAAAVQQSVAADAEITAEWQELTTLGAPLAPKDVPDSVGPLLTTTWDQGQYYNAMCPEDANGPDGHVYTGCVATAMAQIINYWGYPVHGRGIHSYDCNYGTLSVNYDSASYDFEHMPDILTTSSTPEEINAVAKLMHDCGVAANMDYGPAASGTTEINARVALINHFHYSAELSYVSKSYYTEDLWRELLWENINNNRPMLYTGGNHAFVCDGFNADDYFHFNFGWSGYSDGWYLANAINGYNSGQTVLVDIFPDSESNACVGGVGVNQYSVQGVLNIYNNLGKNELATSTSNSIINDNWIFIPDDSTSQLVVEILKHGNEYIDVYDGMTQDVLLRNNDSVTLFSVVSSRNAISIAIYGHPVKDGFHIRVYKDGPCRTVSNIASTVTDSSIQLTWKENGTSSSWSVECRITNSTSELETRIISDSTGISIPIDDTNATYEFMIQPICDIDNNLINSIAINEHIYWTDVVVAEPNGYTIDSSGTILVSSAEGLAWVSRESKRWLDLGYLDYMYRNISIMDDIDLSGYLWKSIGYWYGNIYGNGHVISKMKVVGDPEDREPAALIGQCRGDSIIDLGFENSYTEGMAASIIASHCPVGRTVIMNCYSINHIITSNAGNGSCTGLGGGAKLINCFAVGKLIGGLDISGLGHANLVYNCYSSVELMDNMSWKGLISATGSGASYINCFADIDFVKDTWSQYYIGIFYDQEHTELGYFFGDPQNIRTVRNVAGFSRRGNAMAHTVPDTALNYQYNGSVDLVSALNQGVVEMNSPMLRTWVWDSVSGLPVFGEYYVVTCPNVSGVTASNIVFHDSSAVAISWQENGTASQWEIKCLPSGVMEDDSATFFVTHSSIDTLVGLSLGKLYDIYVRPICDDGGVIVWCDPITFLVDKPYWIDIVTTCPDGYVEDTSGNVFIFSEEGLAWMSVCSNGFHGQMIRNYEGKTVTIASNLNMGRYKWTPISHFLNNGAPIEFKGTILGGNHTISNLYCNERDVNYNWDGMYLGLLGFCKDAYICDIIIKDARVIGYTHVGALTGGATGVNVNNCQMVDVTVQGMGHVGGLIGEFNVISGGSCMMVNSSSTGIVIGDDAVGGLCGQSTQSVVNCYTTAAVIPRGRKLSSYKGGLIGAPSGIIENCYNAGNVEYSTTLWGNSIGSSLGLVYPNCIVHNMYGLRQETRPLFGGIWSDEWATPVISDTTAFNNTGIFENVITIRETPYNDLLSALNAWVDANDTAGVYRHWAADTTGENGGFPVFAPIPCTPATGSDSVVVCDSFTLNGVTYTNSGTVYDTLVASDRCDSIVTIRLTVNLSSNRDIVAAACDSFTWHGNSYTASGNVQWNTSLPNAVGCDSTVTLHLTINRSAETVVTDSAENSYTWNGVTYTESGTYTWVGLTAEGCDSTVTLHLTVVTLQEGIDEADATAARIYAVGSRIVVDGAEGNPVYLYNAIGQLIKSQRKEEDGVMVIEAPAAGVYLVKVGAYPARKVVVIR